MTERMLLTENDVIDGTCNYLLQKGRTARKRPVSRADAEKKQHGIDLKVRLENEQGWGNTYLIEAKRTLKSDGTEMKSDFNTNFRWAVSQIVLRIKVDSTRNNYIYGIAVPDGKIEKCIAMIRDNWALRHLKIRLYGAFRDGDRLFAKEYLPHMIYGGQGRSGSRRGRT